MPSLLRYPALDGKTFLVCVGAAKCATSWLHGYLHSLPDATVSPLKEVHFFNVRFPQNALGDMEGLAVARLRFHLGQPGDPVQNLRDRPNFRASVDRAQMVYDDNAYFAHFARLCGPETRAFCDITPAYAAIGAEGFAYLRAFAASQKVAPKLLFILRDPVTRFWSQLRQLEQLNPENDALCKWPEALRSEALLARADYRATIEALEAVFPSDDLLFLFYEDLLADHSLRRLCAFAGLAFRPPQTRAPQNETEVRTPLPDAAREAFRTRLADQYSFCRARFGDAVPEGWAA
ncbi:sulfotransferase [Salipiger sp. P9]|uniref:sulfotransferase n=1 Tax=Salipiger pentaromativorans TaxID=2943193 RepID=UPI00215766ED|nr:sulfotransferase [Salipiger pentaromativorans]MCR8547591.1 sulfotransferase [Salipiger pentaromativorans]